MSSRRVNRRGNSRRDRRNPVVAQNREIISLQRITTDLEQNDSGTRLPSQRDVQPLKMPRQDTVMFTRSFTGSQITTPPAAGLAGFNQYNFRLSNFPDYVEFTSLFDAYRIVQVELTFIPIAGAATANVGGYYGEIYSVIDYDDSNTLGTISAAQEYNTLQVNVAGKMFTRVLNPRIAIASFSGAFTSYAQLNNAWIDAASPDVYHYGLKVAIAPSTGTSVPLYNVNIKAHIQCKNTR